MKDLAFWVNKIHCGNCTELLKKIPDNSIDVVFTSPPYNKAGYEGFLRKRHPKDAWSRRNINYENDPRNDFMVESEYEEWQIKILNELHRILKPQGSCFYNHKIRVAQHKASHPIEWILKSNFVFRQQIIWNRKATPTVAPIRFLPTTELIFWLTKTRTQPLFRRIDNTSEVITLSPAKNKHPAPFPEELVETILKHIKSNNLVVCDPFIGSGTTAIVAKKLSMNFIGIEISEKYCKMASARLGGADVVYHKPSANKPSAAAIPKKFIKPADGKPTCTYTGKCNYKDANGHCLYSKPCSSRTVD